MKYLALGLLIVSSAVWTIAPSTTNAQTAQPTIAKADSDFSIVLIPDTHLRWMAAMFPDFSNICHRSWSS